MDLVVIELQIKGIDTNTLSGFITMMLTILFDHILGWEPAEKCEWWQPELQILSVSLFGPIIDWCNLRKRCDDGFPVTGKLYSSWSATSAGCST